MGEAHHRAGTRTWGRGENSNPALIPREMQLRLLRWSCTLTIGECGIPTPRMNWGGLMSDWRDRVVTAREAAQKVKSGMRVRIPIGHNPLQICDQLAVRVGEISDIEIAHSAVGASYPWLEPGFEETFSVVHEHWASQVVWEAMKERRHDYMPLPFSLRFKAAMESRSIAEQRHVDVVCLQVSPPDSDGMVNLGRAIWDTPTFMKGATLVLAEIVPDMPIVCGDGSVPADLVSYFVEENATPLQKLVAMPESDQSRLLAANVAQLISDGDTLQVGAGNATYGSSGSLVELLADRNDLGWHAEATPPAFIGLIRSGVMTSARTTPHPGRAVSSHWVVLEEDEAFVDRNPAFLGQEIAKVVDPHVVSQIPNFKSINTVIMIDLSGQATAESIGTQMHSGTGGQLELAMGALWSPGGRAITLLSATDASGSRSRIVPTLPEGTQATIPRTLIDTVVTEYGIARLLGRTVRERAAELISIAAPEFRDELTAASRRLFYP